MLLQSVGAMPHPEGYVFDNTKGKIRNEGRAGKLKWAWPEKLHRLELDDDEEDIRSANPLLHRHPEVGRQVVAASRDAASTLENHLGGNSGQSDGTDDPVCATLVDPERRHRTWGEMSTCGVVERFAQKDALTKLAHKMRKQPSQDDSFSQGHLVGMTSAHQKRSATGLSEVLGIEDELDLLSPETPNLEMPASAFFKMPDSLSQQAPIDKTDQRPHPHNFGSQLQQADLRLGLANVVL